MLDLTGQPHSQWQTRIHDHVPSALREAVAHLCGEFTAAYLLDCLVLHKGIVSRLPKPAENDAIPLLSAEERAERYGTLVNLWSKGCSTVIDEGLFAETVLRRPREYDALRSKFRRKPLSLPAL
ncbi:hypothetical protein PUV47_15625 [Pseudovibrio exalbescens]|uniref:hypothetical protein n=1 Tax=Pseudovibrio exalbescens TaxID=197461 RepID=UPI00236507A7|nr:hypothetical protein [Pseudovibrio exalbescens]MDD7911360.1 hypothetical protein [Pseudovibrio exalbescens]